jgi:cytochrome c peroxidase
MRVHALTIWLLLVPIGAGAGLAETETAATLGRALFFDKRLSADQTVACASCHIPEHAFTNGAALAKGVHGQLGERNVPTLVNRAGTHRQFWDMRAESLEAQAVAVMSSATEMGGALDAAVTRLNADAAMKARFEKVFGRQASSTTLSRALAAYESSLSAGEAPYDRYVKGDLSALTAAQVRGKDLFFNQYKCARCHSGPNFSDEKLNVRCYPFTTNLVAAPLLRFKTPTLRNLIYTAPYMHNGALATLEEAVEFYNPSLHLNADGKPDPMAPAVHISAAQKKDLVAFLKSLSAPQPFVEISPLTTL